MKHVDIRYHRTRQEISIHQVATATNPADTFTKQRPPQQFQPTWTTFSPPMPYRFQEA